MGGAVRNDLQDNAVVRHWMGQSNQQNFPL